MRPQPVTIALGEQSWRVRPLTVAQVQEIEPLLLAAAEAKSGAVSRAIGILRAALARDHAEALPGLEAIETNATEIAAAMRQVLLLGGFLPNEGTSPGEAGAGETPAPTGPDSTPA